MTIYLQVPEREILNFQPHAFKVSAFVTAALLVMQIILDWKFIIEGDFSKIDFFKISIILLVLIITSSTRIILSTHRIQKKFGPFFRYESQRSQVEAITLTPTAQYLQKKSIPFYLKSYLTKKPKS